MEIVAISIFVGLAAIGGWLVVSFAVYRRFFKSVNAVLCRMKIGDLYAMSNEDFLRYDDVIKRSYFAKKSVADAVKAVLDEACR